MSKTPNIIKGSDARFLITLRQDNGDPFPLNGTTLITVRFVKQNTGHLDINTIAIPANSAEVDLTVIADIGLTGAVINVDGNDLTEGVDWTLTVGNNNSTASSIQAAINALATVSATVVGNVINIVADLPGTSGNSIPVSSTDSVNLSFSSSTLLGGFDSFKKVDIFDEFGAGATVAEYLGKLQIRLTNEDTNMLKLQKRMTIEIIVDKGIHPTGDRTTIHIIDAINVLNSPV